MTSIGWKKPALAFGAALVAAAAQTAPASAYQFTFAVTKFAICNPQTKVGRYCSLYMQATNVAPAVPPVVKMSLDLGPALEAIFAGGSSAWKCGISPGGQKVTCNYVGPMPVPMGFAFPPITVRALAKKIMGSFLWAPVFGDVGGLSGERAAAAARTGLHARGHHSVAQNATGRPRALVLESRPPRVDRHGGPGPIGLGSC